MVFGTSPRNLWDLFRIVPGGTQFPSPRPQHRPAANGARRAARRAARRRVAAAGTAGVAGELANALSGLDALRNGALVEVGFAKTWEPISRRYLP
jgi:hypothetical protein